MRRKILAGTWERLSLLGILRKEVSLEDFTAFTSVASAPVYSAPCPKDFFFDSAPHLSSLEP